MNAVKILATIVLVALLAICLADPSVIPCFANSDITLAIAGTVFSARHRPRFGSIPDAIEYSGLGRTTLYKAATSFPGLFRKSGRNVLVDFDQLDAILDSLPVAQLKVSAPFAGKPKLDETA
jgi:hypothetical protein